nr:hypothetical protein [Tanacetum cinerariifolium]
DNSPRIHKNDGYESQRSGNVAGARETVEQADWKDDTDNESDDQELEAHYMYMAKVQEVSPDAVDSGPIFDTKPEQKGDRVMHNNSQGKKKKVEEHRRSVKLSKNKTSVTASNDSLNAKTFNVKSVSMFTPSGYIWKPKSGKENVNSNLVEIVLFIINSGGSKHMTGNLKLLINFVENGGASAWLAARWWWSLVAIVAAAAAAGVAIGVEWQRRWVVGDLGSGGVWGMTSDRSEGGEYFGVRRKSPPEKFFGDDDVVAGGGGRLASGWWLAAGGRE